MKTVKISALVLAMAGVFATSANAQSAKKNAWEGFYGEAAVGYATFNPSVDNAILTPPSPPYPAGTTAPVSSRTNTLNTATNKIGVGYNFGINDKYTLGIAASYAIGASSVAGGEFSVPGQPAKWFNYQLKNIWSATVNPGYAIDKDSLVYAKVGVTGNTMGLNGQTAAYQTNNFTGYVLGLGYKQMVTQSIYLLGEVNYASLNSKTATLITSSGPIVAKLGGSGMDVIFGAGYRF